MVPPGGSATLYGVLYQLLGSLHHTVRLLRVHQSGKTVAGARLTIEPSKGGGDLWIELPGERFAEQWKARTNGRPWGLKEILDKVVPDLYLDPALDRSDDQTRYVFATEGQAGSKAQAFFNRFSGRMPGKNALGDLDQEDRKLLRATAQEVRKRVGVRSENLALTYQKLRRLLSRFEIRENQTVNWLAREIEQMLLPLVDHVEDIPAIRGRLCEIILLRGAGKGMGNDFMPKDLLSEAGLRAVSLENRAELQRTARNILEREVNRRKYDQAKDVRAAPVWPTDRSTLFLSGESGQGKTWQAIRLALGRADEGRLVVLVDSREDAERDLQRASDLLWKESWDHDQPISLDRVVERWHKVHGNAGLPWLTVCVENVQNLSEARALAGNYDWKRWGVELVLTGPPQIGSTLLGEHPEQVHHVRLRDFTPAELREYLRRHGRSWETVRADVRDTLKSPLLAGLYTSLGSNPDFAPIHEYKLYERSWQNIVRDLSQNPEDLNLLKRLALALLNEEPRYPWTWDQLDDAGVSPGTRDRLERIGWWTRNNEGVEVWHDRMLTWALAEVLAERGTIAELASQLRTNRRSENSRLRRVLNYLLMDVLWLLSGNPKRRQLVPDLLASLEEDERPFRARHLYQAGLLPTLGLRIVPWMVERLRRLSDRANSSYTNLVAEALATILDREPDGAADLPRLLADRSISVRKVAVKVLARHPHALAINPLWGFLSEKSSEIEESNGREGVYDRQSAFAALRACLELNPQWLRIKIQELQPEREPAWELAYLLANIKHTSARSIWTDVKNILFEKVPHGKLHSLMVCIRVFRDCEEVPRLEAWLPLTEKWTANNALEGITRIDPDRAVFLLETVDLNVLLSSRGAWLPVLLLNRPDDTRRVLRKRLAEAGADFWRIADLYWWYEEQIDCETLEILLDQLAIEAQDALQGTEEAWNRLHRSLRLLSRIHRADLLESFQDRSGTNLDRSLGELGAVSIDGSRHNLEELRAVLLKIGGKGFRHLVRTGLASSNPDHNEEAMVWGLILPEELAAVASEEWTLAALGKDRTLVEQIMDWEVSRAENDELKTLWQLRRWKPPISDADLALALEALRRANPQKQVQGLAAISISGREDLLSELPDWLKNCGDLGEEHLEALDERAAHLVHRLAEGNTEGVLRLTQTLDLRHFPWTAVQLLYEGAPMEFAERLESSLLEQWVTHGRLGETQLFVALHLAQTKKPADSLLQAVWGSGQNHFLWDNELFFPVVCRIDSEEVRERIWEEAFEALHTDRQINAIRALHLLNPEEAIRAARRGLEDSESSARVSFVSLILELGGMEAVSWLVQQAMQEKKTVVLWAIARALRQSGFEMQTELQTRLGSPDFRIRSAAAHLAGWQGHGFLEADLQQMTEEDPDDDVQWECLQALARQRREGCVVKLMNAFRHANGTTRWSYLESIVALGDPRLLVTEEDSLWLGQILTPELGVMEAHVNFSIKERLKEVALAAERRDNNQKN